MPHVHASTLYFPPVRGMAIFMSVVSHCGFHLHFLNEQWYSASFLEFVSHLYVCRLWTKYLFSPLPIWKTELFEW
jgi:hypothetical protein